jgi:hypothetical protein
MHFSISRPQKRRKAPPGAEAASPPACANGAFICLHDQTHLKNPGSGLGPDYTIIGSSNSNMMLKIEFYKIIVAYGLI